jgi:hypothetical protein
VKLSLSGLEPGTGERTNIGECQRFEPAQIHIVASHSTRVDLVDAASLEGDPRESRLRQIDRAEAAVDEEHVGELGGRQREVVDVRPSHHDAVPAHPQPVERRDTPAGQLDIAPASVTRDQRHRAELVDRDVDERGARGVDVTGGRSGCRIHPRLDETAVRGIHLPPRPSTRTPSRSARCAAR